MNKNLLSKAALKSLKFKRRVIEIKSQKTHKEDNINTEDEVIINPLPLFNPLPHRNSSLILNEAHVFKSHE